jgi:hypothetical protein
VRCGSMDCIKLAQLASGGPRRRQYWSSLRGTCNPLKMAVSCRNMSG